MHAWLAFVAPHVLQEVRPHWTITRVDGYDGVHDAWIDSSAAAEPYLELDVSHLANAAECGVACDTKHYDRCLSFSFRQSDGRCIAYSHTRTHAGYRCCSCGMSNDCQGFDFYQKHLAPPSPPKPPPRPPSGGCNHVDVMVVLDRSNNYNAATWNKVVIPTLKSIVDGVGPSGATNTRLGVVLYPAANGNPGDHSGGARTLIGLSHERFTVDRLIGDVERGVQRSSRKYCEANPSSSLAWPCGGWKYG